MDGGMKMGMPESTERHKGVRIERVDEHSFEEYEDGIEALENDLLNDEDDTGEHEEGLSERYLEHGSHGQLYIALDGDRVVGFVAVKEDPENRTAMIEQVRVHERDEHMLESLMEHVRHGLEAEGVRSTYVAGNHIDHALEETLLEPDARDFFVVVEKEKEEEEEDEDDEDEEEEGDIFGHEKIAS